MLRNLSSPLHLSTKKKHTTNRNTEYDGRGRDAIILFFDKWKNINDTIIKI